MYINYEGYPKYIFDLIQNKITDLSDISNFRGNLASHALLTITQVMCDILWKINGTHLLTAAAVFILQTFLILIIKIYKKTKQGFYYAGHHNGLDLLLKVL